MRVIAIANQKGGTAKTTTAVNLAHGLHACDRKVLAVDMDPQAHLTKSLGIRDVSKTVFDVMTGSAHWKDAIVDRKGIHVLPSGANMTGAELALANETGREALLANAMEDADYDYVLIDCPPNLGLTTLNALRWASESFVVLQLHFLALESLGQVFQTIAIVRDRLSHPIEVSGIVGTFWDARRKLDQQIIDHIEKHYEGMLFKTLIRQNTDAAEAPSRGQTAFEYSANSYAAVDYFKLTKEVIGQEKPGNVLQMGDAHA